MYVVSGCKGRDLTLQGGVIYVTFILQSSFFCLETKERSKEKFKADFFLLLAPCTPLKGRNSLRSNSLPFLTLRYGSSLDGEKSRPERRAGGCRLPGLGHGYGILMLVSQLVGWGVSYLFCLASHRRCIGLVQRECRAFFF